MENDDVLSQNEIDAKLAAFRKDQDKEHESALDSAAAVYSQQPPVHEMIGCLERLEEVTQKLGGLERQIADAKVAVEGIRRVLLGIVQSFK